MYEREEKSVFRYGISVAEAQTSLLAKCHLSRGAKRDDYFRRLYNLSIEGIQKGYLFCQKWYIKGKGVGPRGVASLDKTLLSTPPSLLGK